MVQHGLEQVDSFDSAMLTIARLIILGVSLYSLQVMIKVWRGQASKGNRVIPRPIIVFTAGWLAILALIALDLIVGAKEAISEGWYRTVYAMALIWPTCGLAWIVDLGNRAFPKKYVKVVDPKTGEMRLVELHEKAEDEL